MKKALAVVIVVVCLGAVWYLWGGAPVLDVTTDPSQGGGQQETTQQVSPPAQFSQAQQQLVAASSGIAALVQPVVAAEKSTTNQANRVGRLLDEVERAAESLPKDRYETAAIVDTVGQDRIALFAWVRDNTSFVPYNGALRGSIGVLMDRIGNSLDRALLLSSLLERAGFETRLAMGTLDDASRAKVMATHGSRPRPTPPDISANAEALTRLAQTVGIDESKYRAQVAKMEESRRAVVAEAQARISAQTAAIQSAVARTAAPARVPPPIDEHWWVQVEQDGSWVDLDSTLPAAKPGDTIVPAQTTLAAADLNDERRHLLKIRVMAEVWRNGQRSEEALLEHVFPPSQFHGQRILFSNVPIDWPADEEFLKAAKPTDLVRKSLIDQVEWLPVLRIGSGFVVKMSIDDHGDLHDNTSPDANTTRLARNIARVTQQALSGATDLFSQLPGGAADKPEPKPARTENVAFTSQWIEFELTAPTREPIRGRRVIFDMLTGAERAGGGIVRLGDRERVARALALFGETELLPLFAEIPSSYTASLAAARLRAARQPLIALSRLSGTTAPPKLKEQLQSLEPVPSKLYAIADARFSWNPSRGATYLDRLNLIAHRNEIRLGDSGPLRSRETIDFMANDVAVWPAPGVDPHRMRLAQGVADTVIEGSLLICPPGPTPCERGDNASEIFAATDGKTWTAVAPSSASASLPGVPAAALAMVQADLKEGYAVVLPSTPLTMSGRQVAAWWRVNPQTGETLGMTMDGGSVTMEHVLLAAGVVAAVIKCLPAEGASDAIEIRSLICISGVAFGAAAAVTGVSLGAVGAAIVLLVTIFG